MAERERWATIYAGEWPKAEVQKNGINYALSESSNAGAVEATRTRIDDLPQLHDDVANAVAGVVHAALQGTGTFS